MSYRKKTCALNSEQKRLWRLHATTMDNTLFNNVSLYRVEGDLDLNALGKSFNKILERHAVLRSSVSASGNDPVLSIRDEWSFEISSEVSSSIHSEKQEQELIDRILHRELVTPFDLKKDLPLRASVTSCGEGLNFIAICINFIVADGWSREILCNELCHYYELYTIGSSSTTLPELIVSDYECTSKPAEGAAGNDLEKLKMFWSEYLTGIPNSTELFTDFPRLHNQSFTGNIRKLNLPACLVDKIETIASENDATVKTVLITIFYLLLNRYTNQQSLVSGIPTSTRDTPESENIIGYFVRTLPVKTVYDPDLTFMEYLKSIRESLLKVHANRRLQYEQIVCDVQPERDSGRSSIFQTAFVMQDAPGTSLRLGDLKVTTIPCPLTAEPLDLTLSAAYINRELEIAACYNSDVFSVETIDELLLNYRTLTKQVVGSPVKKICDYRNIDKNEIGRQLVDRQGEEIDYGEFKPVIELFEIQVKQTPDNVAIQIEDNFTSFSELDSRANQIANELVNSGVVNGDVIGICLDRSPEMVSSVLGVLKSGNAFIPLDSNLPQKRIEDITEDSSIKLVITNSSVLRRLNFGDLSVIDMDDVNHGGNMSGTAIKNQIIKPEDPMYIIYTSGSTGIPKGVSVSNAAIANKLLALKELFTLNPDDRQLQFVSFSFDVWIEEVFVALLSGASISILDNVSNLTPLEMLEHCNKYGVSKVNVPGSFWHALVDELTRTGKSLPDCLRIFVTGAESLSFDKLKLWNEVCDPKVRFFNVYGPTEGAIMATAWEYDYKMETIQKYKKVPIGRPLPNTKVYILDEDLCMLPRGVPGELYIGGQSLASSYVNQPEKTAESFLPDPFSTNPESKIYRTGDIGRYLPDGNIDFLGRYDQQVKIRGFRIELEEVEAALVSHPLVSAAAVKITGGEFNERLLAYVVKDQKDALDESDLRSYCLDILPEYMTPSQIVWIESIPMTSSGKIDRNALPDPKDEIFFDSKENSEPRDEVELMVGELFKTSLGIDSISIYDDFFMLGGDSIKGAILINNLQKRLNKYIYIVTLFDSPTIEKLSIYLKKNYPQALSSYFGHHVLDPTNDEKQFLETDLPETIREKDVEILKQAIMPLPVRHTDSQAERKKNGRAVFVLAPPRSGTTLMRVILGGHSNLFAPPELYLLSYNSMGERAKALSGRHEFWREGLIRAVMNLKECDYEKSRSIIAEFENGDMQVSEFYGQLQSWMNEKILVDKTPFYSLDENVLNRAEEDFNEPHYLHLTRHPNGMIKSFIEARIDQLFRFETHNSTLQLAELIWNISHRNILEFFKNVPEERKQRVSFEKLVNDPEPIVRIICEKLAIDFEPSMLKPYEDKRSRMTDSIHPLSQMLGDVKFHDHSGIDPSVADNWKMDSGAMRLSRITAELAVELEYEVFTHVEESASDGPNGRKALDGLSDEEVDKMLKEELDS